MGVFIKLTVVMNSPKFLKVVVVVTIRFQIYSIIIPFPINFPKQIIIISNKSLSGKIVCNLQNVSRIGKAMHIDKITASQISFLASTPDKDTEVGPIINKIIIEIICLLEITSLFNKSSSKSLAGMHLHTVK